MLEDGGATVTTTASAGDTGAMIGGIHPGLLIAITVYPTGWSSLIRSVRVLEAEVTTRTGDASPRAGGPRTLNVRSRQVF